MVDIFKSLRLDDIHIICIYIWLCVYGPCGRWDNALPPVRCQAITWNEIRTKMQKLFFMEMAFNVSSVKWRPPCSGLNTLTHWGRDKNGRLFADDTFERIFLNENIRISIKMSLKFVPRGQISNILALVLIMAWRRQGDKPLSEPMMVRSLTHICVIRPQ